MACDNSRLGCLDGSLASCAVDAILQCEEGGELTPTMVTYNALMQALGAAGRVEEGFALLKRFEAAGYADTSKSYSLHRSLLQLCRRHGTAEQVEAVSERMERRKLTAVAPIAKAADPSHPNGRPLRYTNQNRFTASTNGTASAVGSASPRRKSSG